MVWCPKYRRKVLVGEIAEELRSLLYEKAHALGVAIEALEIVPDPVHLFIESDPTEAPQRLANQFKGYTSRMLRLKFSDLRSRLPSLWSRSYSVGSIGQVSEETVRRYIEMQKSSYSILRTYKYLLRPTPEQAKQLDFLVWQSRLVYNAALEQRISVYRETGKGIRYGEQWVHFRDMRRESPETAESAGIQVIAVHPSNTTQACSGCGTIVPKSLSDHQCPGCGLVLDRDVNAARNILSLALQKSLGRSDQALTWAVTPCVACEAAPF